MELLKIPKFFAVLIILGIVLFILPASIRAVYIPGTDKPPSDGGSWSQTNTPCGSEAYCYQDAVGKYQHWVSPDVIDGTGIPTDSYVPFDGNVYTCGNGYPQTAGTCPTGSTCQQTASSNNPFYNRYECVSKIDVTPIPPFEFATPTPEPSNTDSCNACLSQGLRYLCTTSYLKQSSTTNCSGTDISSSTRTYLDRSSNLTTNISCSLCSGSTATPTPAANETTPTPIRRGTATPTPTKLSCDPVKDGVIDLLDFQLWKDEYIKAKTSTLASCFSPNKAVDLLGFQVWKDIYLKVKKPF